MQCCAGLAEGNPNSRGPWQRVGFQHESLTFPTECCVGVTALPETEGCSKLALCDAVLCHLKVSTAELYF